MSQGGAQLQGADDLIRTLRSAAAALDDMSPAAEEAGQVLATDARANSPVRTGNLAASHGYMLVGTGVEVTASADYAVQVNAREPWFTDTFEDDQQQVIDIYEARVDDVLAQVKGT